MLSSATTVRILFKYTVTTILDSSASRRPPQPQAGYTLRVHTHTGAAGLPPAFPNIFHYHALLPWVMKSVVMAALSCATARKESEQHSVSMLASDMRKLHQPADVPSDQTLHIPRSWLHVWQYIRSCLRHTRAMHKWYSQTSPWSSDR